jgi:hypothetical protein
MDTFATAHIGAADTTDGEPGTGQFETLWPRGCIQRLVTPE